ncbi:MAG: ATP-binding protein [Chloroflexota bacterium]|nr:ATP-binding protein [Chloroflexota bacterium]MDE2909758.1 ATP-binding protein [Chloroflexota bacterium]
MELLLAAVIALASGLAFGVFHQRRRLQALRATIHDRDIALGRLRAKLEKTQIENQETKALSAAICDFSFDIVLLLDQNLSIALANGRARRLFGDGDPSGGNLAGLIESPELLSLAQLALYEDESIEEQFVIEDTNYRARAQTIAVGETQRFIVIGMQDITELVGLNRARRDLVANISHELRTPITRIRLIIEGLFLEADKPKRKASIQSLKEIAMETDALLWLAQELLDLSMIESGEAILRLVKTPLKQVVDEAIARLESQAAMKDLNIICHVPQDYDALCDADQLKRVFGNLLHNAIKWSPQGEAITVTASEQADEFTVSIFDNGPGIPDDLRNRVFERFYQADASRSGDEGTGLGLAICKHIVEAHGGRIWAEGNSLGKGGHFVLTVLKADGEFRQDSPIGERDQPSKALAESAAPP